MRALLLCPADRPGVEALSERTSLSAWPLLGSSLAVHWIEYLAAQGAKHVKVVTPRHVEDLRAEIGNGAERWGIETEIVTDARELTIQEARAEHGPADDVFEAESMPSLPCQHLFGSYGEFFEGLQKTFFILARRGRVGAREIQPGVWVGLRTHVSPEATLQAPCWLGEDVHVEKDAQIGPWAILEDRAWVGAGACVEESIIAPETSLGVATSLRHSIASGNTLIDWKTNSVARISDSFLLCDLRATPFRQRLRRVFARIAELTAPSERSAEAESIHVPTRLEHV